MLPIRTHRKGHDMELTVPKNGMLPIPSGDEAIGAPNMLGQSQAVEADHGELPCSSLPNKRDPYFWVDNLRIEHWLV